MELFVCDLVALNLVLAISFLRRAFDLEFDNNPPKQAQLSIFCSALQLKVAEGASAALRSLYGTRYTSGPGATTICKSKKFCSLIWLLVYACNNFRIY